LTHDLFSLKVLTFEGLNCAILDLSTTIKGASSLGLTGEKNQNKE